MTNSLGKRMFLNKLREVGVVSKKENIKQDQIVQSVTRYQIPNNSKCTIRVNNFPCSDWSDATIYNVSDTVIAERSDLDRLIYVTRIDVGLPQIYKSEAEELQKQKPLNFTMRMYMNKPPKDSNGKKIYVFEFEGKISESKMSYGKYRLTLESVPNGFVPKPD